MATDRAPPFLTTVFRNQYPAFTGKYIHRYAQDSPDLRQKEIIKVIKKVFMHDAGVDRYTSIDYSETETPNTEVAPTVRRWVTAY